MTHDVRVFLTALSEPTTQFPWLPEGNHPLPANLFMKSFLKIFVNGLVINYMFCDEMCSRDYYLVDLAFPCTLEFIPPYTRERYHKTDRHS